MATIRFLKKHSAIPVPEIYGYDPDDDGRVGGKWVIMEYVGLAISIVVVSIMLKLIRSRVRMWIKSGQR